MKLSDLAPYIPIALAVIRFILDEIRYYRKAKREKGNRSTHLEESPQNENGVYPPRKDKHRKR